MCSHLSPSAIFTLRNMTYIVAACAYHIGTFYAGCIVGCCALQRVEIAYWFVPLSWSEQTSDRMTVVHENQSCLYARSAWSGCAAVLFWCLQVGLELSRTLRNLGIIAEFSIGQRASHVKGHGRCWDPLIKSISSTEEAAGYPGMYITICLNWDKHTPLYSTAQPAEALEAHSSSVCGPPVTRASFTPPMRLNSPTPEHIKILSKPSHQRWMGAAELLRLRAASPPGIYLLSTDQGIITDIDAELRGTGGILLARLGLPMGHVIQLRGLLRAKHDAEVPAAQQPEQQLQQAAIQVAEGFSAARRLTTPVQHAPLSHWDARQSAGHLVHRRLSSCDDNKACDYLEALEQADKPHAAFSKEANDKIEQLKLQELAWKQKQGQGYSGKLGRSPATVGRPRSSVGR